MSFFILYISSYLLSYLGYLLGSSTLEEHKEIKNITLNFIIFLKVFYFLIFLILFKNFMILEIIFLFLLILYIIDQKYHFYELEKIINILVLGISILSFVNFKLEFMPIVLIYIFSLIFENSFEKIHMKEETYIIIFYLVIYFLYVTILLF